MRIPGTFILAFMLIMVSGFWPAKAKTNILVGMTSSQPPFVIDIDAGSGLAFDLFDAMNATQDQFHFAVAVFPTRRLLFDRRSTGAQIIGYNDVKWGWQQRGGMASFDLTNGKDVFFSLQDPTNVMEKNGLAAVRGYHYAFADFNPANLEGKSHITLANSEPQILELVLAERVKRGIASISYINWIKTTALEKHQQLVVHTTPDHRYNRQMILFDDSGITVSEFNAILRRLSRAGVLLPLYKRYGQELPDFP